MMNNANAFMPMLNSDTTCAMIRHDLQEVFEAQVTTKAMAFDAIGETQSIIRSELADTFKTPHATGPSGSLEERIGRIEMMLMNMQERQEAQHAEVMARQAAAQAEVKIIEARQEAHHSEVMSALHTVLAAIKSQASVLQEVLHGDSECPRYLMLMPLLGAPTTDPEWIGGKGKGGKKEFKSLLQFVDPVTMTTAGSGFELKADVSELDDCAPALGVALGALSQYSSVSIGRPLGLPNMGLPNMGLPPLGPVPGKPVGEESHIRQSPSCGDGVSESKLVTAAYEAVKATLASADLSSVIDLNEDVLAGRRRNAADLPAEYIEAVQESYAAVTDLLDRLQKGKSWEQQLNDPKRCGLVKAVHSVDGVEWVACRYELLYKLKGR